MQFRTSSGKALPRILGAAGIAGAIAVAAVGYGLSSASAATTRAQAPATVAAPDASAPNAIVGEWSNGFGKIVIEQTGTNVYTDTAATPLHLTDNAGCASVIGTSQGTIFGKGPSYTSSITTYEPSSSGVCAPAGVEDFTFTLESGGNKLDESGEIWTRVPMAVTTASLPNGVKGDAYAKTLGAVGGTPPYYLWHVTSGSLPAGLSLNELTGVISGTPTRVQTVTIKVKVANLSLPARLAPASTASKTFTLKVS
jgi:hypothetical protein